MLQAVTKRVYMVFERRDGGEKWFVRLYRVFESQKLGGPKPTLLLL